MNSPGDGILSPQYLFGNDPEILKLCKKYGINNSNYQDLTLDELKEQLNNLIKDLKEPPKGNLEELKTNLKRNSDLFNAWVGCITYFTKDK